MRTKRFCHIVSVAFIEDVASPSSYGHNLGQFELTELNQSYLWTLMYCLNHEEWDFVFCFVFAIIQKCILFKRTFVVGLFHGCSSD